MEYWPSRSIIPSPSGKPTRPLAPQSAQPWGPRSNIDQSETDIFRFSEDGCIDWSPATDQLVKIHSMYDMNIRSTYKVIAGIDWTNDGDTDNVSLSPSQLSTSYFDGLSHERDDDCSQRSSLSDLDFGAAVADGTSGNRTARRRAQNRQAQRAYRERKEKQLANCKTQIMELEYEVERVRKILDSSPVAVLHDKIMTLETRNRALQRETGKLKGCLHRIAKAMVERGMDQLLVEIVKSMTSATIHPA